MRIPSLTQVSGFFGYGIGNLDARVNIDNLTGRGGYLMNNAFRPQSPRSLPRGGASAALLVEQELHLDRGRLCGRRDQYQGVEPNALGVQQLTVSWGANSFRVELEINHRIHTITSGIGTWRDGESELPGMPPEFTELVGIDASPKRPAKLAAGGAWKDPNTFEMQWRYYDTPHFDTVTLRFAHHRVDVGFSKQSHANGRRRAS